MKIIAGLIGFYLNALALIAPKLAAKQAFFVFCYPFAAKLRPDQQAFLDTGSPSSLEFEGKQVATYSWGSGKEVILCLHGWQSNAFRWKKFIQEFDKERYTLLAVDAPGHGGSEGRILNVPIYARMIALLMNRYQVDHILGHSIGCFAALHSMSEVTDKRPRSMVCIAAPGSAEEFFDYFIEMVGLSKHLEKHLRDYFLSHTGHPVSYFKTTRYVPDLAVKSLIIHDRHDDEVPAYYAEGLHAAWPSSELWLTEGLGHKMRDISVVNRVKEFFEGQITSSVELENSFSKSPAL